MFASLKSKIKEQTGSDVTSNGSIGQHQRLTNYNNNRIRSRFPSTLSVNSNNDDSTSMMGGVENSSNCMTEQLSSMRSQCNDLTTKVTDMKSCLQEMQEEKFRVEKTNEILLETVKVAQTQKDIYCEEQEKIQNLQRNEIDKLKNLLSFREQEAVDRLSTMRNTQQQIDNLNAELERLKQCEPMVEDLQDELERLRHSYQLDKNNLTTTLAAVEEENRHMKMRLQITEKSRLDSLTTLNMDDKLKAMLQERKLLEQHLEEAHLQLSDIKSSWSGQNLALETQVSRLSKQVAEETTEKRKVLKERDDVIEKVKYLEFEMLKLKDEVKQRDDKIKLLEEEIDELNMALKECREDNEQQIVFEQNKVVTLETDVKDLQIRLQTANDRFSEYVSNSDHMSQAQRGKLADMEEKLNDIQSQLETEKDEKLGMMLRNAEISQSEELLRQELRIERDETAELQEKNEKLVEEIKEHLKEINECRISIDDMKFAIQVNEEKLKEVDELQREISDKNKTIKMQNQRLSDLKKTLQKEFRSVQGEINSDKLNPSNGDITLKPSGRVSFIDYPPIESTGDDHSGSNVNVAVMDEVNFTYLKHVIVKFLTSREVEARHLLRAVATLLKLSKEEEKLLNDTLNWKMSWFGSKPNHGSGQHAFSIPPS